MKTTEDLKEEFGYTKSAAILRLAKSCGIGPKATKENPRYFSDEECDLMRSEFERIRKAKPWVAARTGEGFKIDAFYGSIPKGYMLASDLVKDLGVTMKTLREYCRRYGVKHPLPRLYEKGRRGGWALIRNVDAKKIMSKKKEQNIANRRMSAPSAPTRITCQSCKCFTDKTKLYEGMLFTCKKCGNKMLIEIVCYARGISLSLA